jgi:plastocyanin
MPRTVVALWVAMALVLGAGSIAGVAQAGTAKPKTTKKAATKVRCHMVKATKKTKRHKVCVKVKSTTTSAKKAPAPRAAPSVIAPASGAPALGSPLVTPSPSVPTTPAVPAAVTAPVVAPPATDLPAAPVAARLQATTREFSIQLSRPTVAAGALILQLVNRGEDPHDLHVRPAAGGADVLSVGLTDPFGGVSDTNGTLPAGTYTLYCSLPGHEAAGMHATLSVQ